MERVRMDSYIARLFSILGVVMLITCSFSVGAQRQDGRRAAQASGDEKKPQAEEPAKETKEDTWLAIMNGRVHTVSGPSFDVATVLCKNGKIEAVGPHVRVPDEAEVIDASGMDVYPGLIAVQSSGILGGGNPGDSTDVFDLNISLALAGGITTAVSGNTAAKLTFGDIGEIELKDNLFQTIRYDTSNPNARRQLRERLDRLQKYLRELEAYQRERSRNPDAKEPDKGWIRGNYAQLLQLLRGEATARIDANTTHELLQVCELAEDYGIRFVVDGAYEGWTVAPRLARAGVSAIVTPRVRVDPDEDAMRSNGSSIRNPAILHEHGVPVTFIPVGGLFGPGYRISLGGLAGRDLQHLPMEAAFAVRGGMSNEAAIRSVTLDAAKILGVDHRIGSITVGKDADFVIMTGHLLDYTSIPRWTIVNGRVVYDKQKETLFQHIRENGDPNAPPPDEYWPRRLHAPWLNASD